MNSYWRSANFFRLITRKYSLESKGYGLMRSWQLNKYSSYEDLALKDLQVLPARLKPDEILIKVQASSVNRIDVEMCRGFGSTLLNPVRCLRHVDEFPFVPGRDCAGDVVALGKSVGRFKVNDKIWCARWLVGRGTHAEYVVAKQSEASLMPKDLDYAEAAALPYAAGTAWNSLVKNCDLTKGQATKNILVLGGTGGVGNMAIQLAKYFNCNVTTTCSADGFDLMRQLGADYVVDYRSSDYKQLLEELSPYDAILDCSRGSGNGDMLGLLAESSSSKFITLNPPLLPRADHKGLAAGLASSARELISGNIKQLSNGKGMYVWGFFNINSGILDKLRDLVETGKVFPVIDKKVSFENAISAYKLVDEGHTRGKIILTA